jgi:dTDP-4-amino-4,6-dideoxygalactose transaminase
MYSNYLKEIAKEKQIENLKNLAKKIYSDQNLLNVQRRTLLNAYKEKLRELYLNVVRTSDNKTFTSLYYLLKKRSDPEIGKLIYDLHQKGVLNQIEADILFRIYEKKSLEVEEKVGDNSTLAPTTGSENPEPEPVVEPF